VLQAEHKPRSPQNRHSATVVRYANARKRKIFVQKSPKLEYGMSGHFFKLENWIMY